MTGTASRFLFVLTLLCALISASASAIDLKLEDSFHDDYRTGLKARFNSEWDGPANLTGEDLARAFIADHAGEFGVDFSRGELVLSDTQQSMIGTSYRFQQLLHGIEVRGGMINVTLTYVTENVFSVYNNAHTLALAPASRVSFLASDNALDMAWNHLQIHGALMAEPIVELYWECDNGNFRLTYGVHIETEAPYGGWEVKIDAMTGDIFSALDERLYRVKDDFTVTTLADRNAGFSGPVWDRDETIASYLAMKQEMADEMPRDGVRVDGTGVVFDPDPRTTLRLSSLQDGHPDSYFTAAYFTRDLLGLTYSGGLYRVTGPFVNITQWDAPYELPSTTTDGNWTAHRGDNSFNDAMTYYLLDQNQRYIQSLGFTGATGIQEWSIQVDTNGCNGADNSYYIPSTNRIAYGHGCVDDSEDADVILHEYGHAIHRGININWGSWGGDTGAIGEGFGDYWAGSYSYSTLNGTTFQPMWIFSWDGHGDGNQCWYGRRFDCNYNYNPNYTYGAHQSIGGGWQSDELWSNPLYMAMSDLVDDGYTRDSVDQIVLESHFHVGYGVTMRILANATIAAAQALQPSAPHAITFYTRFRARNIVEESTLAVDDVVDASEFKLGASSPNPFYNTSNLSFAVPSQGADVEVAVFDLNGRMVRSLATGFHAGGDHNVSWQGNDDNGDAVGSGVYFYRLKSGDVTEIRQMVMMK
jgi:FlgD Ig-like domain